MQTVTGRINEIKQPSGGYVKPRSLLRIKYDDGKTLNDKENFPPQLIGIVVDYLTRYMLTEDVYESFDISYRGSKIATSYMLSRMKKGEIPYDFEKADQYGFGKALYLIDGIQGLDDESIKRACKVVTYDTWYRNPSGAITSAGPEEINPNRETIENIRIMVKRGLSFLEENGPVVEAGVTFPKCSFTDMICNADADYLTNDTIWDFKVIKSEPSSKHTLELLMYWLLGQHSGKEELERIRNLGIYNPRKNIAYSISLCLIPKAFIEQVSEDVMGYAKY